MAQLPIQTLIKVLRIGILQGGKIVQEKRIDPGRSVTIGSSAKATFPVDLQGIPSRFPLFTVHGDQYELQVLAGMSGKVGTDQQVTDLEQLKRDPKTQRRGDAWVLPISDRNRGKITIGDVTVLFQFVPAPPEPLRPTVPKDFKPRIFDEDDPVFLGFLGLFTVLAGVFVVYIYSVEPEPIVTIAEVQKRFVKIELQEEGEIVDDGATSETKKEEKREIEEQQTESKIPRRELTADEKAAAEIARRRAMEQEVLERSLLLKLIGTRGESADGAAEDLFAEGSGIGQNLETALGEVHGAEIGTQESLAVRAGVGTGISRKDASIGDLALAAGGQSNVGSGPGTKVRGRVTSGAADVTGGDPAVVKKVIGSYIGGVKACYEQRLKANPSLSGRIEISWTISNGRVSGVSLVSNSTGDDELATCIMNRIRHWRFPTDLPPETEVIYPFILAPG
ncbi:MAG: AgmX/PglI C-terminal domain-containing protein [Deltaproteobacteria bacterium]|nr:AgmX/PglI C-terminal domain-containing protein [Deltaproteobacteria bacterium]